MKIKAKSMLPEDQKCILLADEISLKSGYHYNSKEDTISGVEDYGEERTKVGANSALVFMLRGIKRKWKQPIFFL